MTFDMSSIRDNHALTLLRVAPLITSSALTMCHLDQHFIFSTFKRSSSASRVQADQNLQQVFHHFMGIAVPAVIVLEAISYGSLITNVLITGHARKLYAFGLGFSVLHLINAPYAWKLIQKIRGDRATPKERENSLATFRTMNMLRITMSDIPAIAALVGAVVTTFCEVVIKE